MREFNRHGVKFADMTSFAMNPVLETYVPESEITAVVMAKARAAQFAEIRHAGKDARTDATEVRHRFPIELFVAAELITTRVHNLLDKAGLDPPVGIDLLWRVEKLSRNAKQLGQALWTLYCIVSSNTVRETTEYIESARAPNKVE